MTQTFKRATQLFCTLECLSVYSLWVDFYCHGITTMCSIGNFEGWKYAQANNIGSVTRELILFSRFTGNNKFMMMLLLICCAYSGKPVTRMWAALVNSVGCILFFVTMLPTLNDIKDQGGCDPKMPLTMSVMIGGLTVVWLSAAKAEYDDMKDEMKAEQVDKQTKSWALYLVHAVVCVLFFVLMLFMKIMGVMLGGLLVVWLYNDVMEKVTEDKADKKKK